MTGLGALVEALENGLAAPFAEAVGLPVRHLGQGHRDRRGQERP